MSEALHRKCLPIEWLVLDVDGVLTDGAIVYSSGGEELKHFHVRDGSGLRLWREAGKRAAIISGRVSPAVERRAAELKLNPILQGFDDKLSAFRQLLAETGAKPEQICCIGDDYLDLPLLANCGLPVAVGDACTEAKVNAAFVTTTAGGRGAVREVIELILRCQGRWQPLMDLARGAKL